MSDRPPARLRPGLTVLGGLLAVGLLAPLLANDRPLLVAGEAGISCPAAADLWLLGRLFVSIAGSPAQPVPAPAAGTRIVWPPVPYSYRAVSLEEALQAPSGRHLMGTDALGRDILARVLHGAATSLQVGFSATLLALALGALLGGTAGLKGGLADFLLSRIIEVLSCFPPFLLAMALVSISGGAGALPVVVAIGVGRTAAAARFARGEILRFKGGVVWSAARSTGSSMARIALRHILPLVAGPLLVQSIFGMAQAVLLESGLSFLGVGLQPPTPSWGIVLAEGRATLETAWWPILFPSLALALTLAALAWAADRSETGAQ